MLGTGERGTLLGPWHVYDNDGSYMFTTFYVLPLFKPNVDISKML